MLNKNDPLIGAVQQIMTKSQAERDAIKAVNEKFGVLDRKALPHERQREWDAAYKTVLTEGVKTLNEDVQIEEGLKMGDYGHEKEKAEKKKKDLFAKSRKMIATSKIDRWRKGPSDGTESVSQSRRELKEDEQINEVFMEIAENIRRVAANMYEQYGDEGLEAYISTLTEEELELFEASVLPTNLGKGSGQAGQRSVQSADGHGMTMSNANADAKGADLIKKTQQGDRATISSLTPSPADRVRSGQGPTGAPVPPPKPTDPKPTVKTPIMDKAVAQKAAAEAPKPKYSFNPRGSTGDEYKARQAAAKPAAGGAQAATPTKPTASMSGGSGDYRTAQAKPGAPAPAAAKQSFAQAFAAARKKAGGAGGSFEYNGKKYQTNVKGEKYRKASALKKV